MIACELIWFRSLFIISTKIIKIAKSKKLWTWKRNNQLGIHIHKYPCINVLYEIRLKENPTYTFICIHRYIHISTYHPSIHSNIYSYIQVTIHSFIHLYMHIHIFGYIVSSGMYRSMHTHIYIYIWLINIPYLSHVLAFDLRHFRCHVFM